MITLFLKNHIPSITDCQLFPRICPCPVNFSRSPEIVASEDELYFPGSLAASKVR